jgi:hypothetical protein
MKGKGVEIVVAADNGSRTQEISATRAGRRAGITAGRGIVEVGEATPPGEPVRRAKFMASPSGSQPRRKSRTWGDKHAPGAICDPGRWWVNRTARIVPIASKSCGFVDVLDVMDALDVVTAVPATAESS